MTKNIRRASGFTLIELLVVVAIIALLIAILLPSLGRARERAKKAACLANMHSIANAMHMYAGENSDTLPNLNPPSTAGGSFSSLPEVKTALVDSFYAVYLKSPKSVYCPSDTDTPPVLINDVSFNTINSARVSYDFYSVYFLPEWGPKLSRLNNAPLAWDLMGGNGAPTPDEQKWQNHGKAGGHVSFTDGSASWQEQKSWDDKNWPNPANANYQ